MGQEIALSGKTGSQGRHYGKKGYPHLHMNIYSGDSSFFTIKGHKLIPRNMKYVDPLAFFFGKDLDSNTITNMPAAEKSFTLPYMDSSGKIIPPGTKIVWPFVCN